MKTEDILKSEKLPKVIPDANILIGYAIKDDKHSYVSRIAVKALIEKGFCFILPALVIGEFISIYSEKKKTSTKNAVNYFLKKLLNELKNSLRGGPGIDLDKILERYTVFSKKQACKKLQFNDFMIISEALLIKNIKIITCDRQMYLLGKRFLEKNIYYLPDKYEGKKIKSDLNRLNDDIRNL